MRVSTAFNRLLQIPGAPVTDVVIGDRDVEVGYGHHNAQTLTSMIYLTMGGLHPKLPTRT